MALDLLKDDELELLDSKGVEALSDDALERLDAEEAVPAVPASAPASSLPSPIDAAADGLQRLNAGVTDAAKAVATPIAAPIDAAIKRVDDRFALPKIPTVQQTAEGEIHGDLFPDLLTAAAGKISGDLVNKALDDTPELVKRGIKDVTAGAVQLGSGLGGAMRAMGFENIGQMMAKSAQQTAKELMPPDPNIVDQIAQGLGSMAAFMVPGLGVSSSASAVATVAPRLAMFLGTATSSVLEAGVEAGDVYNRVMDKTGSPTEANVAAGRAFFANIPLIHYTNKLGWAGEQASRLSRALESFFTEGFQEGGQEFISNFAAHDPLMKGVVEAAFVGGVVGGAAGAAVHGPVDKIRHPSERSAPAEALPPEQPKLVTAAEAEGGAPAPEPKIATPEEVKAKPEPPKAEPKASKEPKAKKEKKGKKPKAEVAEEAPVEEGAEDTIDPADPLAQLKSEATAENKALGEKLHPTGSEIEFKNEKGKKVKGIVAGHSWSADGFTLKVRVDGKPVGPSEEAVAGGKLIYLGSEEDIGVRSGEKAKLYKEAQEKLEAENEAKRKAELKANDEEAVGRLKALKELHDKAMAAPKDQRAAIAEEYAKLHEVYEKRVQETHYYDRSGIRETAGFIDAPPQSLLYKQVSSEEMDKSPEFQAAVKEAVEASSTRSEFREKLAEIVFAKDVPVSRMLLGQLAGTKAGESLGLDSRDIYGTDTLGGSEFSGDNQAKEMVRVTAPMLEKMKAVKPSKEKAALLKKFAAKLDSILPDTPRKKGRKAGIDEITPETRAALVEAARMGEISEDVVSAITKSGKVTSDGSTGLRGHIQIRTNEMNVDLREGFFDKEMKVSKSNVELMAKAAALDLKKEGLPPSVNEKTRAALVDWVRETTVGWRGASEHLDEVAWVIENFDATAEALYKALRASREESGHHPAYEIVGLRGEAVIKELGWPQNDKALYRNKHTGDLDAYKDLIEPSEEAVKHRGETRDDNAGDVIERYDPVTDPAESIAEAEAFVEQAKSKLKEATGKVQKQLGENGVKAAKKSLDDLKKQLAEPGAVNPDVKSITFTEEDIPPAAPAANVDSIVAQLEKAGYDSKTAKTLAVVFEGFRILGDRAGIAAHELFDSVGIKIVKGEGFTIEMLEGADLQGFLKRATSLYLDALKAVAAAPAASEQVKADYATITTYFQPVDGVITPAHEEHFAQAFQAYLLTGEVSGQNLRTSFDAFKSWLGAVYKQLDAVDADLAPEVKTVLDRMLASEAELKVELDAAEKALGRARKRKAEADSQAPPETPQDAAPAARAAVVEEAVRVKKAKEKAKPIAKQTAEPGALILGVKRSLVESLSEIGALIESPEPMTQLKPNQLEKFAKAGLLDAEFKLTDLARKSVAELARLKELMKVGYLSDTTVSEPKKLTLKALLKSIADGGRFGLLNTYKEGWLTDGRIMFRTMEQDAPVYATFKHLGEKFPGQVNLDLIIKSAERATDEVKAVLGVREVDGKPSYLLQTEAGRQLVVAADYYNFFKERYPEGKMYAQGPGLALKIEQGGQTVGALMPMKVDGPFAVFSLQGEKTVVETSKGHLEVDAKMKEIEVARTRLELDKKVYAENVKEIRQLDETPGEKTAALIAKVASIQQENIALEDKMAEAGKAIATLEEQTEALREEHGIKDIPASGLVKKGRPKGGKGGKSGKIWASSGEFAYDTPVELGGMEHVKPFRMPELVRLAYQLMGDVPVVQRMSAEKRGHFRPRGDGEIALNPIIFQKPEQAAKTLAHEIGHLVDYLPEHTMKRGNLLGSLLSLRSHLANTFGQLTVTNKDLRDELMAVTMYWRPYDPATSTPGFNAYRKSARELYADAISLLFNSPGTLERMAPKFYAGFFTALDQKPAVKLAFFQLQALLNSTELQIQEARHLDRKAMYLNAEDLWALKRKEMEARESHYGEWFKQLVVEKHQKAIGMVEAAASKGAMLPPSADPRYILEELSLADNANHAFLEEVNAKVVQPLTDSEVTLLDLGDYLYLSRVAQGDRQAFANPKGYHPAEATKALEYMATRLGTERYAQLESAAAAFREIVYTLSEEAVEVGAYSREVFEEKIKPNRGSYAVFAVQDYLEDYIAAGVKEQVGTLKDIANPFTATVMKMVALNRLIAKQKGANVMRDFLLARGEAEKAQALNPQDNLVQFRAKKGKGLLELLENGHRAAYYVDPYIAEAFKKKEAGTFHLAVKILDSVFNGVFRPLYITFNIGFQLYSNPLRDFQRAQRNVYALVKNEGYTGTVKSLLLSYFDSLGSAKRRALDIPDALISEMIANKSLDVTFTDFSFDPEADQYTAIMRKMGVAPPQQNGLLDRMSKTKILYPLARFLEGVRFIGNAHETASKIAGYKVLKADQLKTLDKAIAEETATAKAAESEEVKKEALARRDNLAEQRKLLEKGEGEYAHQLAYNTRNYVGTPNWRRRGTISHITNTLFPFSNIMVQGMRSDLEIATRPETRTAFMFNMVLTQVLPKLLMFMGAMGGAGDDLEEFFRKVSEYDKSNYLVIPMGWSYDEKGGRKSVYWRIPHDESGRLAAAVAWKMMNAMRGEPKALQQIVDFGAGQLPNIAPPLTIGATWVAYLSGKNPYDSFRGRPLMPDKVQQAGGRYALSAMVKWTINQMGLASFATHDSSAKSSVESTLEVAPLLNRVIKISDYGEQEESMKTLSAKQAEDAALSLDRGRAAVSYTKERYILSQKQAADEISTEERTRLARLNKYYPVYLTYSKAIKRANEKGDEDKVDHYRERLDSILAKVVD